MPAERPPNPLDLAYWIIESLPQFDEEAFMEDVRSYIDRHPPFKPPESEEQQEIRPVTNDEIAMYATGIAPPDMVKRVEDESLRDETTKDKLDFLLRVTNEPENSSEPG